MFLHFATIEMWPSQPGIELLTSCSAERHSHTTAGWLQAQSKLQVYMDSTV